MPLKYAVMYNRLIYKSEGEASNLLNALKLVFGRCVTRYSRAFFMACKPLCCLISHES